MVTIILTYRNREISIVKNCLNSLKNQSLQKFDVILVNYGSNKNATSAINSIIGEYEFAKIINCRTEGELWCKSRAINIALKQVKAPYVLVGDIDMIFHPDFISKLESIKNEVDVYYFQVGFLDKEESSSFKPFKDYSVKFRSNHEATGITLFKTSDLMAINGYDEFYHGWGSEDTDVHVRLKNSGKTIRFYDKKVLLLHQWHPKHYRSKDSAEPYHSHLEQINQAYLLYTEHSNIIKANLKFGFGNYNESDYKALNNPDLNMECTNGRDQIKGSIQNILMNSNGSVVNLIIRKDPEYRSFKQFLKRLIGKKAFSFLSMQQVNDLILESLITQLRNCPYHYSFDQKNESINLTLKTQDI